MDEEWRMKKIEMAIRQVEVPLWTGLMERSKKKIKKEGE